jgi:hypothetical protein
VKGYVMARRVVVGGFRATCVLASAVSNVAARSITKFFATDESAALSPQRRRSSLPAIDGSARIPPTPRRRDHGHDGILTLVAPNNQGNTIDVYVSGSNIVGKVNATTKSVSASSVKSIKITGGNWNDTIRINSAITKSTTVYGNDGNEKIYGGSGADKVYGGDGHEYVFGNGGNDSLFGEAGNDTLDGGSGTTASSAVRNGCSEERRAGRSVRRRRRALRRPRRAPSASRPLRFGTASLNKKVQTLSSAQRSTWPSCRRRSRWSRRARPPA